MAQSFRFDVRDNQTGEVMKFRELLGLLYYGCATATATSTGSGSSPTRTRSPSTSRSPTRRRTARGSTSRCEKLAILNRAFNERLRTADKKILILPDFFGLYKDLSYGEIMIDFGLTSMEEKADSHR